MLEANRRSPPYFRNRLGEGCAAVACLFLSGIFLGCHPTPERALDPATVGHSSLPIDADPYFAEQVGREALAKIGYIPIMNLAREAGWVTTIESTSRSDRALLAMGGAEAAVARGFIEAFSKYAVAAGVVSQSDTPLPGPGDAVAIGIVVIGLIDAGLLAGALLDALGDVASPAISTTTSAAATAAPTATAAPIATSRPRPDLEKDEECYEKCKHLLPSPSGDLQASEYRKCYRECKGTL